MAKEQILIGCRLPHGLTLTHPVTNEKVTILGKFTSRIVGAAHAVTSIDQEFWDTWKTAYRDYTPLKNGSIFEAKSPQEAEAKAKERIKEKTGFEPMAPDTGGVKSADKK